MRRPHEPRERKGKGGGGGRWREGGMGVRLGWGWGREIDMGKKILNISAEDRNRFWIENKRK